jgi:hypothetical protein
MIRWKIPTLLLTGGETASPQLKLEIRTLLDSLPDRRLFVLEGQQHDAMDTVPQEVCRGGRELPVEHSRQKMHEIALTGRCFQAYMQARLLGGMV